MASSCTDFCALVGRLGRFARGLQYGDGLNPAQWEALRFLARANRYSCNPSALAEFLGSTKGTVSQTLIALEGKGYLRRVRGFRDRRAVRLELTAAGEALLAGDPLVRLNAAAERLEPTLRAALIEGLGQILRNVERGEGCSEFGICVTCGAFLGDAAVGEPEGPNRCGLTGEPVSADEAGRICVSYRV